MKLPDNRTDNAHAIKDGSALIHRSAPLVSGSQEGYGSLHEMLLSIVRIGIKLNKSSLLTKRRSSSNLKLWVVQYLIVLRDQ